MLTRTFFARAPLAPNRFAPLPAGAVSARGAMREKLIEMRGGLLSRCASLFPEAGEQSAWFGGPLSGGLHAANLLEALLLTGALLGDEELRRQSLSLCERVIAAQREDGAFGAPNESFAARGRMLRALLTAYSMTGDKHTLTFMLRYMKYLQDSLRISPLSAEDAMHVSDTLEAGITLYNITGQKAILSVMQLLINQGTDYTSVYHAFPYRTPISRAFPERAILDALSTEDASGYTHHLLRMANGANLCEGLRQSALSGMLTGSGKHISAPEIGLARLNKAHGAAAGGITADPLLGGTHPSRGVSATASCELAASLETMFACQDGECGADQLETLMYNTIDAFFAADGRGVQPIQQANQAQLSRDARFPLSSKDAGMFSTEDGDALCALLAAWPRFMQSQWMVTRDDGLCAMGYAPCSVRYRLGDVSVRLKVESRYPADGSIRISVHTDKDAAFPLYLRIPAWAEGATAAVDGEILPAEAGRFAVINREWHDGDELLLTLPMFARKLPAFHQAVTVARGPLRFVYAPQFTQEGDTQRAEEDFAVALVGHSNIEAVLSENGILLRTHVLPCPHWVMRGTSCDQPPIVTGEIDFSAAFETDLVPYAKAAIRLCVLPLV